MQREARAIPSHMHSLSRSQLVAAAALTSSVLACSPSSNADVYGAPPAPTNAEAPAYGGPPEPPEQPPLIGPADAGAAEPQSSTKPNGTPPPESMMALYGAPPDDDGPPSPSR